MKILIAAGGTGGHLYPAVALSRELKKKGCEVLFAVRPNELVLKVLNSEKIPFVSIKSAPMAGQSILNRLKGFWLNFSAVFSSIRLIHNFKPQSVVGFGAYVSVPVILAAYFKKIPIFLHEQNPVPGWANRVCARFAEKVAVSFQETEPYFLNKSVLTGNILREEFFRIQKKNSSFSTQLKKNLKTVFVFGGSAGAKSINQWMCESLPQCSDLKDSVQFIHVSGSSEESVKLKEKYEEFRFHSIVMDYADKIWDCYAESDLVISRAGATTLTELILTRTPAILIPYPYAGKHQSGNAKILEKLGSALVIEENDSGIKELVLKLRELILSDEKLDAMRKSYENFPVNLKNSVQKLATMVMDKQVAG